MTSPLPRESSALRAADYLAEQQHRQMGELTRENATLRGERDRYRDANATYKHLARAARLLVEGFDNEDQEAIDSGLAGLRENR
jgi:hypothetical protein